LGCPSPASRAIAVQGRPRSLALEHGDLLAESHNFQGSIGSGPEESARSSQEAEKELKHELTVVTWRNAISIGALDIAQLIDFVFRRGIVYAQWCPRPVFGPGGTAANVARKGFVYCPLMLTKQPFLKHGWRYSGNKGP
jgi:hypothetical protein